MRCPPAPLVAALLALAACSEADPPPRLTRFDLSGTRAFVTVVPDASPMSVRSPQVLAVRSDGTLAPLAADGWALVGTMPYWDGQVRWSYHYGPIRPRLVSSLSARHLRLSFGFDAPDDWKYYRGDALVDRGTGEVTALGVLDLSPPPQAVGPVLQEDAAGGLYVVRNEGTSPPWVVLRGVSLGSEGATLGWPLSAEKDDVRGFLVNAAGELAYAAVRTEADGSARDVVALKPVAGPLTIWEADPARGDLWVGADGRFLVTRGLGDAAGTVELDRVGPGPAFALEPLASWTGAPAPLRGQPLPLGGAHVFLQDGAVVVVDPGAGPPAVFPLGFEVGPRASSGGALWLGRLDGGVATGVVRFTPAGSTALLGDGAFEVRALAPVGDDLALVGAIRRSDGARQVLSLGADGAWSEVPGLGPSPGLLEVPDGGIVRLP